MTNETKKLTPRISVPIKQVNFGLQVNNLETLEYVKVGAITNSSKKNSNHYNLGFFGKKFSVYGEAYFTLLDILPTSEDQIMSVASNLYKISYGNLLYSQLNEQRDLCVKNNLNLEEVINNHIKIFRKEIIRDESLSKKQRINKK